MILKRSTEIGKRVPVPSTACLSVVVGDRLFIEASATTNADKITTIQKHLLLPIVFFVFVFVFDDKKIKKNEKNL